MGQRTRGRRSGPGRRRTRRRKAANDLGAGPTDRRSGGAHGYANANARHAPAALLEERLLGLTLAERADIQRRLTRLGYDTYGSDGTFGGSTRRAIATWQGDEGDAITGYLTADQVRLIRVETGG